MFQIDVQKAKPSAKTIEPLVTSGSLNAFSVQFKFNEEWDGMTKFATFRIKGQPIIEILLDETNICDIPWELMKDPGVQIQVGAYGIKIGDDKHIRLPTTWINLQNVSEGVLFGTEGREPTPDIYEQFVEALNKIPKPMTIDELKEILYPEVVKTK